jgi:hypothetical protein
LRSLEVRVPRVGHDLERIVAANRAPGDAGRAAVVERDRLA